MFDISAPVPFEVPKAQATIIWIDVLFLLVCIQYVVAPFHVRFHAKNMQLILVLFGVIAGISGLGGVDPVKSFYGNYYRFDGLVVLFHLIVFAFMIGVIWKKEWDQGLVRSVAFSVISLALVAMYTGLSHFNGFPLKQQAVTFGNPKFLAGYLVVGLPFILYEAFGARKLKRLAWLVGAVLVLFAFPFVHAMGAYVALGGGLVVAVRLFGTLSKKWYRLILMMFVLFIVCVAGYYFVARPPYSVQADRRDRIFAKAIVAWWHRPALGWGWANFDEAFRTTDWPDHFSIDAYVDKAHSELVEVLTTTGVAGFICFSILMWRTWKGGICQKHAFTRFLMVPFVVYLVHAQTNVISISESLLFWFMVGRVEAENR